MARYLEPSHGARAGGAETVLFHKVRGKARTDVGLMTGRLKGKDTR